MKFEPLISWVIYASHDLSRLNQNSTLVKLIVSKKLYEKKIKRCLKGAIMVTSGIIP